MLYALYSNSQLIYPVFGVTDEQGQAVIFFSLHIIRPLQHVTQILFLV